MAVKKTEDSEAHDFLKPYLDKKDEELPLRERRIKAASNLVRDSEVVFVEGEYWIRAFLEEAGMHDITLSLFENVVKELATWREEALRGRQDV